MDKWLNGTISANELKQLETYPAFGAYRKIDAYTKRLETPDFDTAAGYQAIKSRLKTVPHTETKVRALPVLLKIAAVLIVLLASYVYINSLPTHIETSIAESKTVVLPDTSEVIVNENSTVSYNENKWEDERVVNLQGEAYFKVAKGETFTVATTRGTVQVLGTQFNVSDTGATFMVECYEGKVSVTHQATQLQLSQGQAAVLQDNLLVRKDVYVNKPVWFGKESSFDNVPIAQVLDDLKDRYEIVLNTQNIDVTLRFTGSFTHTDLDAALQTITIPLGLTYTIENNNTVTIVPATELD